MEQKTKQNFSEKRVLQTIIEALKNQRACNNTFKNSLNNIKEVKNHNNKTVLDFKIQVGKDFYQKSGFFEKTPIKVSSIILKDKDPKDISGTDCSSISRAGSSIKIPDDNNSDIEHSLYTLIIKFTRGGNPRKTKCSYSPIYTRLNRSRFESCSSSPAMTDRFHCDKQTVRITCCRYIYEVTLDPKVFYQRGDRSKNNSPRAIQINTNDYIFSNHPDPYEEKITNVDKNVEIIKLNSDDPNLSLKENARRDCQNGDNLPHLSGICSFNHGWKFKMTCFK